MHVFAPHGAPRYARAAGEVAREVRGDILWLTSVMEAWGGQQSRLSAMVGWTASWSSPDFYDKYSREGARGCPNGHLLESI